MSGSTMSVSVDIDAYDAPEDRNKRRVVALRKRADEIRTAILRSSLTPQQKNIGVAILQHLHTTVDPDFGLMWPDPATTAEDAGCKLGSEKAHRSAIRVVRRALQRIVEKGFLVKAELGGGRAKTTRYALPGIALENSDRQLRLTVTGVSSNSDSAGPQTVTGGSPDSLEEGLPEHTRRAREALDADFGEFAKIYPHMVEFPKAERAYIAARRKATKEEIHDGARRYAAEKPASHHWQSPAKWLDLERWRDKPGPSPEQREMFLSFPGGRGATSSRSSQSEWEGRLRCYFGDGERFRGGTWSSKWGPRPDEPGCFAPAEMIATARARSAA